MIAGAVPSALDDVPANAEDPNEKDGKVPDLDDVPANEEDPNAKDGAVLNFDEVPLDTIDPDAKGGGFSSDPTLGDFSGNPN